MRDYLHGFCVVALAFVAFAATLTHLPLEKPWGIPLAFLIPFLLMFGALHAYEGRVSNETCDGIEEW